MDKINVKWKLAQKLEYLWWKRYLKKKNPSEYLIKKKQYWDRLLNEIGTSVKLTKDAVVLDAGCGPSGIYMSLSDCKVDAIDPLLNKYQHLSVFQPEQYSWTQFKTMPIEALDVQAKYDVVFCMNAINHVNDLERCYQNLLNALKPGGILVLSTDAHRSQLLKKIFQLLPGDMLHPIQLDIDEYAAYLEKYSASLVQKIRFKRELIFDYYILIAQKDC